MIPRTPGIHHVTAIAGSAKANVDFYTRILGFRLVKKTVNFDDNFTYHLYFGDQTGSPGTAMTFFPWEYAHKGRNGRGVAQTTVFRIPAEALLFWENRLASLNIPFRKSTVFGITQLLFTDFDGTELGLEPAGHETPAIQPPVHAGIPASMAIRGFAGVTLNSIAPEKSRAFLSKVLGFTHVATENGRSRMAPSGHSGDSWVDILETRDEAGKLGRGIVHHVAFRTLSDTDQQAWLDHLFAAGVRVTGVKDRQYFHSIYFHEPGGILFEIATDGPGFLADEDEITLGTALKLPPWIEPRRAEIEQALPTLY
jgi:glyoxalase family protein